MTADLLRLLALAHPHKTPEQLQLLLDETPDNPRARAAEKPASARCGSRARTAASMGRRRSWAAGGHLPPRLAALFSLAEQAALAVVAAEIRKRGACTLTVDHLAAVAGIGPSSARNAIREAKALGLVTVEEKRRTAWMSYPNTIKIVSPEWGCWLRLYGFKSVKPTPKDSRKEDARRSTPNAARGFRNEKAAQASGQTSKAGPPQASPRPDTAAGRGLQARPSLDRGPTKTGMPGVQRRRM